MITYFVEKKSWIAGFFFILLFSNLLFWLDPGLKLSGSSVLYFNGVLIICFIPFLLWRAMRETRYLKEVEEIALHNEVSDWGPLLPEAEGVNEKRWQAVLSDASQSARHQAALNEDRHSLKSADIEAWVHEMKAPLTSLKLQIDAEKENPVMQKIDFEWSRLHFLLEQQLYQARLSSIEHDTVMEHTEFGQIIFPEIKSLSAVCRARGIGFEIEGEELTVLTDLKWSRFIFRQVLTNAVKYSPDQSEIIISGEKNERFAEILIKDEGRGIKPEHLPRIFEKGFTGEAGRQQSNATGLGLYLAKQAADSFGIKIDVRLQEKGTEVRLIFPLPDTFQKPLHTR
ncbi:sensor histidine kinase [Jeotgalibacillus proteolyticus]|uniref:histidine kinase n=1 Tax=Jeotgalibacillus proteolyticus TaxID=2082395 RepID=A0A2S5G9H2_9BACL|nr:sensor histidine kinase [Jeotgalibacillus proteolyticus]PPA69573.1 sensor histidine kinase [Jeotgalibacillus proteolyticus]